MVEPVPRTRLRMASCHPADNGNPRRARRPTGLQLRLVPARPAVMRAENKYDPLGSDKRKTPDGFVDSQRSDSVCLSVGNAFSISLQAIRKTDLSTFV